MTEKILSAIHDGDWEAIEDFIADKDKNLNGYEIKSKHSDRKTPLIVAIEEHDTKIVKLLLAAKVDVNITSTKRAFNALIRAVYADEYNMVDILIRLTKDINYQQPSTGRGALLLAVSNGYRDIAELLIRKGADVNVQDKNGRTVLNEALRSGDIKLFNLILSAKPTLLETPERPLMFDSSTKKFKEKYDTFVLHQKNLKKLGKYASLMD